MCIGQVATVEPRVALLETDNVRNVRSPATVLRTLGARGPANQRFPFGPFRTLTSPESRIRVRSSRYFALSVSVETVGIEPTSAIA